ncbi:hypothetical protein L3X38_037281 [Prunus dulcis]|uniref:Uncharacterized protein n=1 Tax=Prunus dulcis TaxID=3755 RepID=A0AAD4YQI9_PRUDU|nr:hypothetical protein L3X38_037281 [Prunus dulcis]
MFTTSTSPFSKCPLGQHLFCDIHLDIDFSIFEVTTGTSPHLRTATLLPFYNVSRVHLLQNMAPILLRLHQHITLYSPKELFQECHSAPSNSSLA